MLSCEKTPFNGRKWPKQRLAIWKQFYFSINNGNFSPRKYSVKKNCSSRFSSFNGALSMAWVAKLNAKNKKIVNKNGQIYSWGRGALKCKTEKAVDRFCVSLCAWCFVGEYSGEDRKKVKVNVQPKWTNEWNNKHNNNTSHNTKPNQAEKSVPWSWLIVLHSSFTLDLRNAHKHCVSCFSHANSLASSFWWKYRFQITWWTRSNCICYFCNELLINQKKSCIIWRAS